MPVDPIIFEVIRSRLDGIVREMQIDTFRTGYSTLIRETHDLSCGLVDKEGAWSLSSPAFPSTSAPIRNASRDSTGITRE